jgi:ribose transport system permease protein
VSKRLSDQPPPLYLLRKIFQPRELVILGVLALELAIFAVLSQALTDNHRQFVTLPNIMGEAKAVSIIAIGAVGTSLVILTGGIDLSVGTTLGLTAVSASLLFSAPGLSLPVPVLALLALLIPLLVGLVNGSVISYLQIPPFIVTLGMMSVTNGLAFLLTNGANVPSVEKPFHPDVRGLLDLMAWPRGLDSVMSTGVIAMVLLALAAGFFLHATPLGRHLLALGGSEEAARHAGVRVARVKLFAYVLSALTAGIAGLFHVAYYGGANSGVGPGKELSIIAAAVVGGVSLTGGKGSPLGAVIGALIVQLLDAGMVFMGYPKANSQIAQGIFIILAIVMDRLLARAGGAVATHHRQGQATAPPG